MNARYIVAKQIFSSATCYAVLDELGTYISLAEGGTKTVLANHFDKLAAIADAKHDHSEGKHNEAYGSVWRRVGKNGGLYSLVHPALPLCDYVPATCEELLQRAIAHEKARLEHDMRVLQAKLSNLVKL